MRKLKVLADKAGAAVVRRFKFLADETGATAIEYGLIAALVTIAAITAFRAFSAAANNLLGYVTSSFLSVL